MPTAAITETMRTLHRILRQQADVRERIAAGPRQVAAHEARVAAAEAARTAAQDEAKKAKMAADQKQLQLKTSETKLGDLEGKLNACKTNREYQLLGEQIAADKMAMKVLEDEILEALERVDTVRGSIPAAEAVVKEAGRVLADAKARVAAEGRNLTGEADRLRGELETHERELPADVRAVYDRIVRQKAEDGLAPVEGESCGGCFRQITGNMQSELLMGRMVTCRTCGRLLYVPESSAAT
jgi:predicted  nucleic acid-binding Zn-ribbon protein